MIGEPIRRQIEEVLATPGHEDALRIRLRQLDESGNRDEAAGDRVISLLKTYILRAPELLEACADAAQSAGVGAEAMPILEAAAAYFQEPLDYIPDHMGLYGLLDDAYLVHSYVTEISAVYQDFAGHPLVPVDLAAMNAAARAVIGPETVGRLDQAVAATVRGASLHERIKALAETGRALTFEKTSAPESWGDSWEEEMARVGKRAGLPVGP